MTHPTPARDAAGRYFALDGDTRHRSERRGKPLSLREVEVLSLVARGRTNAEIAYVLGFSEQTAKNHMTSILAKLNVSDRASAAVKYALGIEGAVSHATALLDTTERLLLTVRADIDSTLEYVKQARGEVERTPELELRRADAPFPPVRIVQTPPRPDRQH